LQWIYHFARTTNTFIEKAHQQTWKHVRYSRKEHSTTNKLIIKIARVAVKKKTEHRLPLIIKCRHQICRVLVNILNWLLFFYYCISYMSSTSNLRLPLSTGKTISPAQRHWPWKQHLSRAITILCSRLMLLYIGYSNIIVLFLLALY